MARVLVIGTMDTKGRESAYLARRLREQGCEVTVMDVGILGEPFVLAVGEDDLTKSNSVDQGTRTTTGRIVLQGSGSLKNLKGTTAVATVFRMSWRQINNYEEVRAAP